MAYLKTINTALAALRTNPDTKHLAKMGIDKLLQNLEQVPEDLRGPVRNGGEPPHRLRHGHRHGVHVCSQPSHAMRVIVMQRLMPLLAQVEALSTTFYSGTA